MRAKLHSLTSSDVPDLRKFAPPDEAFCIPVRALIGPGGGRGEESFDFEVCSPAWLKKELERREVMSGRHYLFMAQFNFGAIERNVLKRIAQATGADWREIANKLARWAYWEFEE